MPLPVWKRASAKKLFLHMWCADSRFGEWQTTHLSPSRILMKSLHLLKQLLTDAPLSMAL
jgi:hypothetical protein